MVSVEALSCLSLDLLVLKKFETVSIVSPPEKMEKLFGCAENFNTLGGFSVIPTLIGEKLRPGKHVFISMSGTWFVHKEGIEKLLELVTHIDIEEDQIIIFFVDKTNYVFYI